MSPRPIGISSVAVDILKVLLVGGEIGFAPSGNAADLNDNEDQISLESLKEQIRIAQELAIAKRIEVADEVEIEEYYDDNLEGNAGLKGNKEGMSLGVNGSSKKVVKRVYKFKGYNEKKMDIYEQTLKKIFKIEENNLEERVEDNIE